MSKGLSIDQLTPFTAFIRALDSTIQTRSMYPPGHPIHTDSVKRAKSALDAWFRVASKLELGFSPKNLVLDGEFIKESNLAFSSVATYFHSRGLLALSITRSVTEAEFTTLLDSLRGTPEAIAEGGGIAPKLRACSHISIKEIDYRSVLAASRRTTASDPIRLWESLCRMAETVTSDSADSVLAMAKEPDKTAAACNAAYAAAGKDHDGVMGKMRRVLGAIGRESAQLGRDGDRSCRQSFAVIAAKLNPELVRTLFEKGGDAPEASALQEMLLQGLPESAVADLIVSIIDRQGKVDKNLIELFGKLSRKTTKLTEVASIMADRLRQSGESPGDGLAAVREAIQEALKIAPRDDFMSKVYKLTVDTVSERVSAVGNLSAPLKALIKDFEARLQPEHAERDKAELLLNVLWFESDTVHFKQLSALLLDALRACPPEQMHALARDALKLYSEKITGADPGQEAIAREAELALSQTGKIVGAPFLVSLISEAGNTLLRGIGRALGGLDVHAADPLVSAFLNERSIAGKERYAILLSGVAFTRKQVRSIVAALRKERDAKSRDIMLGVLLHNGDEQQTADLFAMLGKPLFVSEHIRAAVRLCGERRLAGMVQHLAKILDVRPRLDWRGYGALRTEAAFSLLKIGTPEARQALQHHENNNDHAVRQACERMLGTASAE